MSSRAPSLTETSSTFPSRTTSSLTTSPTCLPELARYEARSPTDLTLTPSIAVITSPDPGRLQSHPLTRFLRAEPVTRPSSLGRALRQDIVDAVESLRPTAEVSPSSHASRTYQILRLRFVDALEVPQVLDRLSLSKTLYYVELQRPVEGLSAVQVWMPS